MEHKNNFTIKTLLLFCFMVSYVGLFAQEEVVDNSVQLHRPTWAIKFSPLTFLNYTPGFQFAVEQGLSEHRAMEYEVAFLNDLKLEGRGDFWGYQMKVQYRFYKKNKIGTKKNRFIAPQIGWKQTFAKGIGTFSRFDNAYQEALEYRIRNNTFSIYGVLGRAWPIGERWGIEYALGLGVRYVNVKFKDIPEDSNLPQTDDFFFFDPSLDEGNHAIPDGYFTLKVNYFITK